MFNELFIREVVLKEPITKGSYLKKLPVIKNFYNLKLTSQVTFFVGENGTGKSTLMEAIAIAYGFNAEGGSKNFNFTSAQTHSELYQHLTLIKGARKARDGFFLRAESFYNVATEVDRLDLVQNYGGKSLHAQSHGESFMALIQNRFKGQGVYILDEPEAALSPMRQFALLTIINQLVEKGSQFIITTHSPILMAYPNASIFVLEEEGIKLTPYEETEHYILTKQFLQDPQRMLTYLFEK